MPLPYCRFSPAISSDSQGSGAGLGGATGGLRAAATGVAGLAATGAVGAGVAGLEAAGLAEPGAFAVAGIAAAVSGAFSAACDGLVGFVSSDIAVCLFLVVSQNPHAHLLLTAHEPASEVLRSLAFVINVTQWISSASAASTVIPSAASTVIPSAAREPYSCHHSCHSERLAAVCFSRAAFGSRGQSRGTLRCGSIALTWCPLSALLRQMWVDRLSLSERSEDCHPERSEVSLFPPQICC